MNERDSKPAVMPLLPGIDMFDALNRLGGNRALLDKVYLDFCRQYAEAGQEIGRLAGTGAPAEAAALAHAVKGVAGNIGAKRIYAAAKALEAALLAGSETSDLVEALQDALGELSQAELA